jgi:hypothetical protein
LLTISLTPRCCQKHEAWLHIFAEDTQNNPYTHSYKEKARFHSVFLATMLSYATCFQRKQGVIDKFEYLGEFKQDFQKC